jgi:integrase
MEIVPLTEPTGAPTRVDLALAAWLHAKTQRSQSVKTLTTYRAILSEFRALLRAQGTDLDAADPQQIRRDLRAAGAADGDVAELIAQREAERLTMLVLAAQGYAAQPVQTPYGARAVAPSTANLRLAALSSFYAYALRQGLLHGENPILRVERRKVQAYAHARPLDYSELAAQLEAIDRATPAGLRDYAILVLALYTGRRLSELAAMRQDDIIVRKTQVEITWPRCKGGKVMHDDLPLRGEAGIAAQALVGWLTWLAQDAPAPDERAVGWRQPDAPVWISLARNGSFGQPLSIRSIATICEERLGTSKVHALRHTFARALEDAGAKVSDIQARLGHASLDTTGRYLAQMHQGENPYLTRLSALYGITTSDQHDAD